MSILRTALASILLLSQHCWAQLKDENLLVVLPTGYKVDYQTRQGNMVLTEMVPGSETVKNWTEIVTTQIYLGLKNVTPEQFKASMEKRWIASCKDARSHPVTQGHENGYSFALWLLTCPLNQTTGRPEITWFKAIKGNDSFYLVQKAFKFEPTKEQVSQWMQYLRRVTVCDTRLPDRPCPKSAQPAK